MANIKNETKSQVNAFGLIRFLSAIAIVLFHYNKLTGGLHTDNQQPWYSLFWLAYVHGGTLVELFFIISGFCFVVFYRDKILRGDLTFKRFVMHRFGRVLPSYWLSTVLIVIFTLLSVHVLGSTIIGAGGNITDLRFLPLNIICLNFANPVNGVAWFLAVNLFCYVWYYLMYCSAKICVKTKGNRAIESPMNGIRKHERCLGFVLFTVSILVASVCVYIMKGNPLQNVARGIASFGVGGVLQHLIIGRHTTRIGSVTFQLWHQ